MELKENNALLLQKEDEKQFDEICKREKVPYAVLGACAACKKEVEGHSTIRIDVNMSYAECV